MKENGILERLKELIGEEKVKAAVFFTFNFNSEFFENYILPVFVPGIKFTNQTIVNSLLWRECAQNLPPISVYCDYKAVESSYAPTLDYKLFPVCMSEGGGASVACFHLKHSFILLDNRLIVISGSNNITQEAWLRNVEGVSVLTLTNGKFFPRRFRDGLLETFNHIVKTYGPSGTDYSANSPETCVRQYLRKKSFTDAADDPLYYSSVNYKNGFREFIRELQHEYNQDRMFDLCEVISPFISCSTRLAEDLKQCVREVNLLVPMDDCGVVTLQYQTFETYKSLVNWCRWKKEAQPQELDKSSRFVHAKLYRFYGKQCVITIVGSVNFTEAGWNYSSKRNLESAVAYIESAEHGQCLLELCNPDDQFDFKQNENSVALENRMPEPCLECEMNWRTQIFKYRFMNRIGNGGKYSMQVGGSDGLMKRNLSHTLDWTELGKIKAKNMLHAIALHPVVKLTDETSGTEYLFFMCHKHFQEKPLVAKRRLTDAEILLLWNILIDSKRVSLDDINEFNHLLLNRNMNVSGEEGETYKPVEGIINRMSSHISTLVNLHHKYIEKAEVNKDEFERFFFADNLNTIAGYRRVLVEDFNEKCDLSLRWFLQRLLLKRFYGKKEFRKYYKKEMNDELENRRLSIVEELKSEICETEEKLKTFLPKEKLEWFYGQI